MVPFDDSSAPKPIRQFVATNQHIAFYDYVRRGAIGEVYFGKRIKLQDDVVVKFYLGKPHFDESEEAVILQNINHPNILKLHDLRFLPPEYPYFISPKIEGGDLQEMIDKGPIPTGLALKLVADILQGVTELHSKHRLVHRDLKPGNILFDSIEEKAVVADLGAVKKVSHSDGSTTGSKATWLYLPPESLIDDKYYFQSDIYQVGLIMFQLLGGHFPINHPVKWLTKQEMKSIDAITNSLQKDRKFDEIMDAKLRKGKLADKTTLPKYINSKFKRVLSKALQPDHSCRYLNTSLFHKDVHELIEKYPSYHGTEDCLLITCANGKEFRAFKDVIGSYVLEKRINGKAWRRDNSHDGTFDSILQYCNN